jgi:glutamyl-Q tRNA(Asp) synthetase
VPNRLYRGRFAPSPSGPLHLGSLLAAIASYLDAKANQGEWLVRIEDIDPPREQAGASDIILQSLLDHGLQWDGDVVYQSQRSNHYDHILTQLWQRDLLFYCTCTRAQLQGYEVYPGHCRTRSHSPQTPAAWRLKADESLQSWQDGMQGFQAWPMTSVGDTVVKRKDGLYAYQLAVVVDDHLQGISHVVRGIDLLDSTPRQLYLYRALGWQPPVFSHIPVILDSQGNKLSKQNHAAPIVSHEAKTNLLRCLQWLNQATPSDTSSVDSILSFAVEHWRPEVIAGHHNIALSS